MPPAMPSSGKRYVILHADDFGFSPAVSAGIVRAAREGVLTSTSMATNMSHATAAAAMLADLPQLGVGIHLNVSQGPALSEAGRRELAGPDGVMARSAMGVIVDVCRRPTLLGAIEAEFDAQVRWALDRGVRPTHLDSHRHSHGFPPVFDRAVRVARRYGIACVRRLREALPGRGWPVAPAKQRRTSAVLTCLGAVAAVGWPALHATTGTWGVAHTGYIDAEWLSLAARRLPVGVTEIMTHPGEADERASGAGRLHASRPVELAALCAPRVRGILDRHGIQRIHYGHLGR